MLRRCTSPVHRVVLIGVVLLASIFPVDLFPGSLPIPKGIDGQYSGKQGQIVVVKVPTDDRMAQVQGTFLGRRVAFFPEPRAGEPHGFVALLGLDLQDEPGTHELTVDITSRDQRTQLSFNILVVKEKFHVEHLKLPKDKVDLDDKSVARWKAEQDQVKAALATDSQMRLWQTGFVEPVNGKRTGIFGSVRIMNGQARNPHNGEDIGAPLGAEVVATNDGIVRLTVDHIFSGKGVYVDHGLGLYSMYFHLSQILVKEGDLVRAGQVLGNVGATGRATGPHLHWGVKVNGARVNPYALLALPLQPPAALPDPLSEPASTPAVPVNQ
ncbi:MAG: M23 family metallopeptidase [Nitrospiraceae bacterium]|nr:M23 family metallopeptidase [Nitrospiraceae bacterium]